MLAKYVLCILTIEWAVLGMRLLKGKGRSYERIRNDDRILTIRFFELTALALFGRLLYGNWKYSGKIWIRW